MKKGHAVIVIGIVLGAFIIGVSFFLNDPSDQSGFQFEQSVTISTPDRIYFQISADDANVSVTYDDRADLLYFINVTGYPDSSEAHIRFVKNSDSWGIFFTANRQESVDIVLGTGCFYFLNVLVSNTNTSITYSNNAWVNGSAFMYSGGDDSDLTLEITDDIRTTDTVGFTGTVRCRSLNLEIDTPFEWNGLIDLNHSNVTIMEESGWVELIFEYGVVKTTIDYEGNPSIELDVEVDRGFVWLRV